MRDSFSDYLALRPAGGAAGADAAGLSDICSTGGGYDQTDAEGSFIGVAGAHSVLGGAPSVASTVENPLNALHEEIGARLRLALPGMGLGAFAAANPLLAGGALQPQASGYSAASMAVSSVDGQVEGGRQAAQQVQFAPGARQAAPAHRSLARVSSGGSASASGGGASSSGHHVVNMQGVMAQQQRAGRDGASSSSLARVSYGSQGSVSSRGSGSPRGLGGRLNRILRQRRAQQQLQQQQDGMSDCHDSVRTFGQGSNGGSGTATPALSLSRDSWNSTELLVSPAPPGPGGQQAPPHFDLL
jgi:hypothetical protein